MSCFTDLGASLTRPLPDHQDASRRADRRRALLHLALVCAVLLALVLLAGSGLGDAAIEGGA